MERKAEDLQGWAEAAADQLLSDKNIGRGVCLFLGAADTGKTSVAAALANRLSRYAPVAFIDADVGQSHIGPPATVGCAVIHRPCSDLAALTPEAIAFVGDITPVGHLLQFTAALARCIAAVCDKADIILIDTPGLIAGGAAAALWWTVHRMLHPTTIIALQRQNELRNVLAGLNRFDTHIEQIPTPAGLRTKSPEQRRRHRIRLFAEYFRHAKVQPLNLAEVALQSGRTIHDGCAGRLVALVDRTNTELALGAITHWDVDRGYAAVLTPLTDMRAVRCLVIGDAKIDTN